MVAHFPEDVLAEWTQRDGPPGESTGQLAGSVGYDARPIAAAVEECLSEATEAPDHGRTRRV